MGFLRIMFCFWKLRDIRYLFYLVSTTLMILVLMKLKEKAGIKGWLPALVGFSFSVINLHAICFSFFCEIIIMMIGCLVVLYLGEKEWYVEKKGLIFLIIGSLNFAMGPFVSPILPLGMVLLMDILYGKHTIGKKAEWVEIVTNSVFWVLGYGGTMMMKQILSYAVLGEQTGTENALMWVGMEFGLRERLMIIYNNILRFMSPEPIKIPALVIILVILLILALKFYRKSNKIGQLLFVALYPVYWMLIIARHSQHSFASNALCVTAFGLLSIITYQVDWNKIKQNMGI